MYKMYLISAEGYVNADVRFLKIRKTYEIWASMKNVGSSMGEKNIFDLVLKKYMVFMGKKINKRRN